MGTIRIACQAKDYINYKQIKPFQGELKSLSKENFEKLKKQILETGFAFPVLVWKNPQDNEIYTIGGHQRLRTISQLVEREGYQCPDLPVVFIEARDIKEAKKRILQDVSQYGYIESQGLYEFSSLSNIGLEELKDFDFPNLDLNVFEDDFYETSKQITDEEIYSKKITLPAYEPKNEKPKLSEIVNSEKRDALLKKINITEGLTKEEKDLLLFAAERHLVFNYSKIADFYAHSRKEVQELMEDSALVIIDFNKAIEDGFVKLSYDLAEAYKESEDE